MNILIKMYNLGIDYESVYLKKLYNCDEVYYFLRGKYIR